MDTEGEHSATPAPDSTLAMLTELGLRSIAPIMRMWRAGLKESLDDVPRPFDSPHASAPGPDAARVLIFGAGLAVGWGVITHDLALPGFVARALASLTRRGTDVDVVADPNTLLREAQSKLSKLPLWRYDAIIIVLGVNESLHLASSRAWRRHLTAVLAAIHDSVDVPVAVTGVQRIRSIPIYDSGIGTIADIHATRLNRVSRQICGSLPNAIFVPLPDFALTQRDRHRSPNTFAECARVMSTALAPRLLIPRHRASDPYPSVFLAEARAQALHQAAVDTVDLSRPELRRTIYQVLEIARQSLNVSAAAFSVLNDGDQLVLASRGVTAAAMPSAGSVTEATLHHWGGMTIADVRDDARFHNDPLFAGDPPFKFYAGFPLESSSGERIATLCVLNTKPQDPSDFDFVTLRNLALRVQKELQKIR